MFLQQCSSEEFYNIINEFENEKASDISARVLERVKDQISGHLSGFINKFMELGTFPKILKIGKVSPILKKVTPSYLTIIAQYQSYQYLDFFLKRFCIIDFIAFLCQKM